MDIYVRLGKKTNPEYMVSVTIFPVAKTWRDATTRHTKKGDIKNVWQKAASSYDCAGELMGKGREGRLEGKRDEGRQWVHPFKTRPIFLLVISLFSLQCPP